MSSTTTRSSSVPPAATRRHLLEARATLASLASKSKSTGQRSWLLRRLLGDPRKRIEKEQNQLEQRIATLEAELATQLSPPPSPASPIDERDRGIQTNKPRAQALQSAAQAPTRHLTKPTAQASQSPEHSAASHSPGTVPAGLAQAQLLKDLESANNTACIMTPCWDIAAFAAYYPVFRDLLRRNVSIKVITTPENHKHSSGVPNALHMLGVTLALSDKIDSTTIAIDDQPHWQGDYSLFSLNPTGSLTQATQYGNTEKILSPILTSAVPVPPPTCTTCEAPAKLRYSYKGPFWGCSRFPDCKGSA